MAYPGIVLAVILGVAVGSFILYCFTEESPSASYKTGYSTSDHAQIPNSWNRTPGSGSSSSQRRRRKHSSSNNCTICQEELVSAVTQKLKCGHEFHSSCLKKLFQHQRVCPNCRDSITFN